jgi:hypothetical protein
VGRLDDAVDLFAIAGGEADAPTFFVFSGILYHSSAFVNRFFPKIFAFFPHILSAPGDTTGVPRVQKTEVYLMDNTKNTKNANTNETTENTNTKNTKNAKNTKNCK